MPKNKPSSKQKAQHDKFVELARESGADESEAAFVTKVRAISSTKPGVKRMRKPFGKRGSWFAKCEGERLPCVHARWWRAGSQPSYHDIHARPEQQKFKELVPEIERLRRVILTSDETKNDHNFKRTDYLGLFEVADIQFDETGLRFKFTKELGRF